MPGSFKLKEIIKDENGENEELKITGYATTNDKDRHGDIVEASAWKGGLKNYLNNPIILAYHKHDEPIGLTVELEHDEKGLKITALISKAAGNIYDLIKEGVLRTFSVGFIAKDGEYIREENTFYITKAELYEVSVVSVPANAQAVFSVMKNFDNESDYESFKSQFTKNIPGKEEKTLMDPKDKTENTSVDIAKLTEEAANKAAEAVRKALAEEAAEKARKEAEEKAAAEKLHIEVKSVADKIIEDIRKGYDSEITTLKSELEEAKKAAVEKQEEVFAALRAQGTDKSIFDVKGKQGLTDHEKQTAVLAHLALQRPYESIGYVKSLMQKSGLEHWDSGISVEWEEIFNTTVHNEMREKLVVEPLFNTMPMNARTVNIPVNPEAGDASWIAESAYRSTNKSSTGTASEHKLGENSITAYKLAAKEYIGYEETEDTIVAIMPIIREAIARSMARGSDKALLLGAGDVSSNDPIAGITNLGASVTSVDLAGGANWEGAFDDSGDGYGKLLTARKNLGLYGDDPSSLVFVVSPAAYYEMLNWEKFQTVDKIGADRASLRTGQVGSVGGIDVVMSRMFNNSAITSGTVGTAVATLVRPSNFLVGNLRNTLTESDKDIEDQRNIIVSTRRFGFTDLDVGQGVVSFLIAS